LSPFFQYLKTDCGAAFVVLTHQHEGQTRLLQMGENEIQSLIEELQIHQIELLMQNENLLQVQSELADSRDWLSELYEFAPVGYLAIDHHGWIQ